MKLYVANIIGNRDIELLEAMRYKQLQLHKGIRNKHPAYSLGDVDNFECNKPRSKYAHKAND